VTIAGSALRLLEHDARARDDFGMLRGSLYLLIEGGGRWSLDALLARKPKGELS
jgi:uncharacterized membrane protein YphA (DoxX/SURF4 family)